jgi:hypothetical protein
MAVINFPYSISKCNNHISAKCNCPFETQSDPDGNWSGGNMECYKKRNNQLKSSKYYNESCAQLCTIFRTWNDISYGFNQILDKWN